jgi:Mrp family chromosome partitioning ATPase
MGKNFEWTPRADISLGAVPTPATVGNESAVKNKSLSSVETIKAVAPAVREESLKLVQRLFLTPGQPAPKAVVFAAIDSGGACSRLCGVVAEILAESVSGSVCLVDGNFRAPLLADSFGVENHHGLADSLRQEGPMRGFATQLKPRGLWLVSSGSLEKDSLNLLHGGRMKQRIAEIRGEFDYVLLDVPPLNLFEDALAFGQLVDGAVLVVEANTTRREAAMRAADRLRQAGIPVLGAVLNNRTFAIPKALYERV